MLKAVVPREVVVGPAGVSRWPPAASPVTAGPFPGDAPAPSPTAWPQPALRLAQHGSLLAGTEGRAEEQAEGSRALLAQSRPLAC